MNTPKAVLNNQANFALGKYEALPPGEKAVIDQHMECLKEHYAAKCYNNIPALAGKLELLMMLGTWLNQNVP
jgi:hypothetical protein